jgi:hypothetical protein
VVCQQATVERAVSTLLTSHLPTQPRRRHTLEYKAPFLKPCFSVTPVTRMNTTLKHTEPSSTYDFLLIIRFFKKYIALYIFCAGISEEDSQRFRQSNKLKTGICRNPLFNVHSIFSFGGIYLKKFFDTGAVAQLGRKHRLSFYSAQEVQI